MKKIIIFVCMFFCISIVNASVNYDLIWRTEQNEDIAFNENMEVSKLSDGYLIYTLAMSGESNLTKISLDGEIINVINIRWGYYINVKDFVFIVDTIDDVLYKYDSNLSLVDKLENISYSYVKYDDEYLYFLNSNGSSTNFYKIDYDLNVENVEYDLKNYSYYNSNDKYMYFYKKDYDVDTCNYDFEMIKTDYNFNIVDSFNFLNYAEINNRISGLSQKYWINEFGKYVYFDMAKDNFVEVDNTSEILIANDLYELCNESQCRLRISDNYYILEDYSVTDDEWLDYVEGTISFYNSKKELIYSFENYYLHNRINKLDASDEYIVSWISDGVYDNENISFIYNIGKNEINELESTDAYVVDILDGELYVVRRGNEGTYFEKYSLTYMINQDKAIGGSVTLDSNNAVVGEEIKINVNVDEGYYLNSIDVIDSDGNFIDVVDGMFIMPSGNVTIKAQFLVKNSNTIDIILLVLMVALFSLFYVMNIKKILGKR